MTKPFLLSTQNKPPEAWIGATSRNRMRFVWASLPATQNNEKLQGKSVKFNECVTWKIITNISRNMELGVWNNIQWGTKELYRETWIALRATKHENWPACPEQCGIGDENAESYAVKIIAQMKGILCNTATVHSVLSPKYCNWVTELGGPEIIDHFPSEDIRNSTLPICIKQSTVNMTELNLSY